MNYVPTKEELIEDYFNSRMTHQEIAEKYGYKTRQVVNRWFKKYQLKSKSKSELSRERFLKENSLPTKEELVELYKNNSISQISKIIGISRKSVSNLMVDTGTLMKKKKLLKTNF
jgi:transposase-like protein